MPQYPKIYSTNIGIDVKVENPASTKNDSNMVPAGDSNAPLFFGNTKKPPAYIEKFGVKIGENTTQWNTPPPIPKGCEPFELQVTCEESDYYRYLYF